MDFQPADQQEGDGFWPLYILREALGATTSAASW